jgi:hypothetical protein
MQGHVWPKKFQESRASICQHLRTRHSDRYGMNDSNVEYIGLQDCQLNRKTNIHGRKCARLFIKNKLCKTELSLPYT